MKKIIMFSIIGFIAQLVDGSLGMAYGVTSTTFFIYIGISPLLASMTVHFSEIFTTAASGLSHLKFGNIDRKIFVQLTIPGAIGAFLGATVLSNLSGDLIKPYIAILLLVLGVYIFVRFLFLANLKKGDENNTVSFKKAVPVGLVAGFVDAIGGGGWGPIATPTLLSQKGISVRKVIGTVNASEFIIALSASIGFFLSVSDEVIEWTLVTPFIIGGVVAAPIAGWLVRIVREQLLGVIVGGFIVLINSKTIMNTFFEEDSFHLVIYGGVLLIWSFSILYCVVKIRQTP